MTIADGARQAVLGAAQAALQKAVALAPDSWVPGGKPDPLIRQQHGHVGRSVSRLDGDLRVRGAATFAAEFDLDGMLYASVLFSTVAWGRITAMDTAAAEAVTGVALVMTHRNAPTMKAAPVFMTAEKAIGGDDLPVMQDDQIHWNGQSVAMVVAETQEQADHAASLIGVTYAVEPGVTSFAEARASGTEPGLYGGQPLQLAVGDADAMLAQSAYRVDQVYRTPRHNHNAIELHACTAVWEGDTLRMHDATQGVAHTAWSLGQVFGIDEKQVHVTSPFVGGGFGGKGLWQHQILAAAGAKLLGRPVRMMLSREGVYRVVGGRTATEQRVALGADADGRLQALVHTGDVVISIHNTFPEPFILPSRSVYATASLKLDVQVARMNMVANTFMRAPGEAVGSFALESAMDELAVAMGVDPIALRLLNEPEREAATGLPFSSRELAKAYRDGAARFGWPARTAPRTRQEGEWLIGTGVATASYPYARFPGGAARITLARDGHATIDVAAHDMGMGTTTAQTQICADRLALEMEQVTFRHGDSTLPGVIVAGGSQQTAAIGAAVFAAHRALVGELLKLAGNASPLSGLGVEQVGSMRAGLASLDDPERYESYTAILGRAQREEIVVEASAPPPLETMHWSMHSNGALFCEMRVNAVTGEIRVSRFLGSFDCGRIINPKTATSQFRGGIIMGLGLALMEETLFDERTGRIMNPSLAEYHVPVHMDVPEIEVMWTDIADPHAPMGARGIGEIGITGVGAAVANAIYDATGKRVRDLPITLDKLM